MAQHMLVRSSYGRKSLVSIKYEDLHSFKEGVILLCQSMLETRRISHITFTWLTSLYNPFNMGYYGAAVMSNLERAFDVTWRKGVTYKYCKAGLKGTLLIFLISFHVNRFSRNLVNGYISEWFERHTMYERHTMNLYFVMLSIEIHL